MSNVPGPQAPLFLAGSQLDQCMFWVPQSGDIGIGVSILSYNGGVQFGIVTDDALVQDPDNIIKRFAPEFEKLVMIALMDEWE
jgi:diacylglycerol O-acyltransferase / wax synthase